MSITETIASGKFKRIIVVTGAGVSTNSGIPDYRSKTGLFAELLAEFPQIKSPESLFSRSLVTKYKIYDHEIYKDRIQVVKNAIPTCTHMLCKWLSDKGWLVRIYTQNIDGLHQKAGLPEEMVVEYHGSLIKDNVILYGDSIAQSALDQTAADFINNTDPIDLILVMGTSLQVSPFCAIPNLVNKSCTRILVDICPENAMKNDWSVIKRQPECLYDLRTTMRSKSYIKFGKRKVTLRPQWGHNSRWKSQYIIKSDCDVWSNEILNGPDGLMVDN
jgi:NAD-dependent SIR2 family protein deacetylase